MTSQLSSIENFDCEGDPSSLGLRWERWKRALDIYLLATGTEDSLKKRAILLHTGGFALQDVYYNLPGAHVDITDSSDVFKIAIEKLDEYFSPKQSYVYERHLFRLMKQESEEKFDKFLIRLRNQSSKCNFARKEDDLIDQIVEKCSSSELRKKILLQGDSTTIEKIIVEANSIETVERQLKEYQGKPNLVNKIRTKPTDKSIRCTRCGSTYHDSDDIQCVARNSSCQKCGFIGHFKNQCRTRRNKRLGVQMPVKRQNIKKYKSINLSNKQILNGESKQSSKSPETTVSPNINYIFHIDDDAEITCQIGGVSVNMLIDSGSKSNIIDDKTWAYLKLNAVEIFNQEKGSDQTFMAYGSKDPLDVLGSFEASVTVGPEKGTAKFYVINNGTRNLLGKETAMSLNILKLGISINLLNSDTFPKFKDVQLDIAIDKSITPICQPYRRVPIPLENKINKKIDELVKKDIIEPVYKAANWVSPLVPILKSDGDVRLCIDMRCANKAIMRENHPLPTMTQLLPKLGKARIFSKLDIKDAFHQVEISGKCRDITTFITSKGLFRYKRLMFGISCAPEHFQKIMERMLLSCAGVINFIDDIIVFGSNEKEHNARLKHVLHILEHNNVLLNKEKCIFKQSKIEFLGHELTPGGIKPLDKYVKTIESFREPKSVEEVQSFLGLVNYIGKWIPNLATITEPIREILRYKLSKHADITEFWKEKQIYAFATLKQILTNLHTLGFYDPHDKTQVIADASPVGLGAVLIQYDIRGPRIIAYGHKSLTSVEKRYCQTEKEALALVWAIEHFCMYLYGLKEFELVTDHKPLEIIFGPRSKPCARIERWVLRLQAYNFKVVYRSGKNNIADSLSRLCRTQNLNPFDDEYHVNQIVHLARPLAISMEDIIKASQKDNYIQLVKMGLAGKNWDPEVNHYKLFEHELWVHDDILLRGNKIVIPFELRKPVLASAHEGHPGIVAMKNRLRTKVWWPKIDKDAENTVKSCKSCILVSGPSFPVPMKRRELPSHPWTDIAVDFLGPLPSGHYLFVVVDYYSRYKEIKIMKSVTSLETIGILKEIFSRLGIPVSITSDNGRQFTSEEFKSFCLEFGITLHNSIPYWPQQNGEVERQNRDILKRLKISQSQKSDWRDELLRYLMMYNSTPHSTTGKTPSELFLCRSFRDKIPSVIDVENRHINLDVYDKDKSMKEMGKIIEDRKRKAKHNDITVGEKVYMKNMIKENKLTPNFNPTPHTVIGVKAGDISIKNDETGQELRRNIVHLKKVEGQWEIYNENEKGGKEDNQIEIAK
ncbi:uncharacterized protein K02A2.6-like [Galleria mellonella]|uniref:RNA-directed DNA polymerase n=1 Tax=Galleria mellonella TaxID=7137 RepID=A0ABM3N3S8_GALME|nr:uncharacterized protein K02A2.6-like [Galleria mellonella]